MASESEERASSSVPARRRLRGPEDLDRTLRLARPSGWIALVTLGVMLLAVVVWAFAGTITFHSSGLGVVLRERSTLMDVIAAANGIVTEVTVEVGDAVTAGAPLATMAFPTREAERDAQVAVVDELRAQYERQQAFLEEDFPRRARNVSEQVASIEKTIAADEQLVEFLAALNTTQQQELQKGYITRQQVESTLNSLHSTQASIRSARNQIRTLETDYAEYVNSSSQSLSDLAQRLLQARQSLEQMNVSLEQDSVLESPTDGRVTGIEVNLGERVELGAQVVTIEAAGGSLSTVGYFQNAEGKRLVPGLEARVAPLSVERDIYGTIKGHVTSVSPVPETEQELMRIFGNETLVRQLMQSGAPIQAEIELEPDDSTPSGLAWTSLQGPPRTITSGSTAEVRVSVRTDHPIVLLLPILRTWVF